MQRKPHKGAGSSHPKSNPGSRGGSPPFPGDECSRSLPRHHPRASRIPGSGERGPASPVSALPQKQSHLGCCVCCCVPALGPVGRDAVLSVCLCSVTRLLAPPTPMELQEDMGARGRPSRDPSSSMEREALAGEYQRGGGGRRRHWEPGHLGSPPGSAPSALPPCFPPCIRPDSHSCCLQCPGDDPGLPQSWGVFSEMNPNPGLGTTRASPSHRRGSD